MSASVYSLPKSAYTPKEGKKYRGGGGGSQPDGGWDSGETIVSPLSSSYPTLIFLLPPLSLCPSHILFNSSPTPQPIYANYFED